MNELNIINLCKECAKNEIYSKEIYSQNLKQISDDSFGLYLCDECLKLIAVKKFELNKS